MALQKFVEGQVVAGVLIERLEWFWVSVEVTKPARFHGVHLLVFVIIVYWSCPIPYLTICVLIGCIRADSPHWHGVLNVRWDFQRTLEMLVCVDRIWAIALHDFNFLFWWHWVANLFLRLSLVCCPMFCCLGGFWSTLLSLDVRVCWRGLWWLTDNCCYRAVLLVDGLLGWLTKLDWWLLCFQRAIWICICVSLPSVLPVLWWGEMELWGHQVCFWWNSRSCWVLPLAHTLGQVLCL